MLPTISERRLHDAPPYPAHNHQEYHRDDDRREWRYAGAPTSSRPAYAYDEAPPGHAHAPAPLPPLRSTLSYRDDDAWGQRALPPPPSSNASSAVAQSHTRSRLDLFSHLPLSSSSRVQVVDDRGAMDEDDHDDDAYHLHHGAHPYHAQQHQQHAAMHHNDKFMNEASSAKGNGSAAASAAAAAAAKRRSRRMSNSERGKLYRSRRKEYVETLEDQVEALKQQLEEMRVKGHSSASDQPPRPPSPYDTLALSRDRSRAGLSRIVCEYFSLFQFGVPVSPSNGASGAGNSQPQVGSPSQGLISQSPRLLSFIETLMDPNMRFGENFGVQMLLEQWQRYSAYHSSLQYDLNSIEVVSHETSPLISATATLRVRFSRTTIEKVFPHVLWNEDLVQRLIGLQVEYPVGNKFYFGPDGKIKRYETEVDFVSAFAKALGNMHDAMQLVGNARIKEQHRIGDDGTEDASAGGAFGTSSSRSPTGSQGSGASSRSSVHSQSQSPELTATEAPMRSRFKQSALRKAEDQYGDYSPQSTARRFPSEPRVGQAYYEETVASRPFARAAGEPGLRHHHYHQQHVNDDEHDIEDHHDRRSFQQYH